MMTFREIIESLDALSAEDQASLFNVLRQRLAQKAEETQETRMPESGDRFWQGVLRFRETIEQEGIEFTDADFADLRDRSPGREIEL